MPEHISVLSPNRSADQLTTVDRETLPMPQAITPIAVRPWTLNGLSERLLVSHYEHHYGSAVRTLNAVRSELAAARCRPARLPRSPPSNAMSWRRWAPIALHELYFGNLGGEGNKVPDPVADHPRGALRKCLGMATGIRQGRHGPSPTGPAGSPSRTPGGQSSSGTRSPLITLRRRSTRRQCSCSTCMSTRTTWTSARTPRRTSTPSCGTSTGRR